ncbi:hypothetical protein Bca52824_064809 [Brassica carinata]|uniref:DUF4283 domain-containing protein n=1 Tax=Brassica carinata TaxID=52824 RepID=A0A8X7U9E4_BRACI|nr:hypothetical protein Bca52824_064809 [Brassica carinata]
MNRQVESRARGASEIVRRRTQENDEEEIIRVPTFDNSDLIAKFKQTLIGRMFHPDGRSVEALLKHMPKRRIWDVEGRVRGTNLGNNRFHFDFDKEEDLIKVLKKKRWTPTIKEDFPNSLPFWTVVSGVPIHYKKLETYESVGKALGVYDKADVEGGRRISHEEGTCPELNENQRERNRLTRIEQKDKEERATREAFSQPQRRSPGAYNDRYDLENRGREKRPMYLESPGAHRGSQREDERQHDLRKQLKEKREVHSKNVWNRLENNNYSELPRNRARYHPYQYSSGVLQRERTRDTGSSSEWHPKRIQGTQYENQSKKHWDQGYTNSRSRMSIDSQRTISENPRRQDYRAPARRWKSRSPPSGTLEWRPVNRARESEMPRGLLKNDNLVGNPKGSSGGEVPEESANNRSNTETQGRLQDNQTTHCMDIDSNERGHEEETARSKERLPQTNDLNQGLRVEQGDEERLSRNYLRSALRTKPLCRRLRLACSIFKEWRKVDAQETQWKKKNKQRSQQNASLGRKRGARSPDLKGASASRKLAGRGRLSPKSKLMKSIREALDESRKVPRHEVYPSAIKSRKPVSTLGSMVSQKPSSTRI